MKNHQGADSMSVDELPDLTSLILRPDQKATIPPRRSPRKHASASLSVNIQPTVASFISASSDKHVINSSPSKRSPSKRIPLKPIQGRGRKAVENVPWLTAKSDIVQVDSIASASNRSSPYFKQRLLLNMGSSKVTIQSQKFTNHKRAPDAGKEVEVGGLPEQRNFIKPRSTRGTREVSETEKQTKHNATFSRASRFILDEARCENLGESSGSEGEDSDTDLSGFIVDDDAEISTYNTSSDSEFEQQRRRENSSSRPRRRLHRGQRKRVVESDEANKDEDSELAAALNDIDPGGNTLEEYKNTQRTKTIEVVDLTSSPTQQKPPDHPSHSARRQLFHQTFSQNLDVFDDFNNALKLKPSSQSNSISLPRKMDPHRAEQSSDHQVSAKDDLQIATRDPKTPPVTPPRSPTKLKSPTKLLSPSKRGDMDVRSPHRQSMDAFWDHNTINEWNDEFSPKKAPAASPHKNMLAHFDTWSDSEADFPSTLQDSSDSLPSPCASPSKSRFTSPVKEEKAEKKRLTEEKRAKQAQKKQFEDRKHVIGSELLQALDRNVTNSQISKMAAGTGGVNIIWSKTLRSTAGRANWKRTVTKSTGSPVKVTTSSAELAKETGVTVQHFANIELAEKVVDREERLINTLAHEFCHLANFMISGIRDQPHGDSFKRWATKVTKWMRLQTQHPEWHIVKVTTKHGYVIEHKYLWICAGRQPNMAMKLLNLEDEEGCGAEYGRHSKSIDVDKHRCGRCKGMLVQVRPKPRVSPSKKQNKSPLKQGGKLDISVLEKMVEVIELSD